MKRRPGLPTLTRNNFRYIAMTKTFDLQENARAMHSFTLGMVEANQRKAKPWDNSFIPGIEKLREQIRVEENGGGMCHVVTEVLFKQYGWEQLLVSYTDTLGRVICFGHVISALPDGSLLDPTADQLGEGHSVRVLTPTDPDYGRYRPEFDEDINPSVAMYADFAPFYWNGQADSAHQDSMREQFGEGWWLEDKTAYLNYLKHQVALGGASYQYAVKAIERTLAVCT